MSDTLIIDRRQQAIEILSNTADGDDLAPMHLKVLELVVNDRASDAGKAEFDRLYVQVKQGQYVRPWFHDNENLTKDHEGNVFWRGKAVEHYSFQDRESERIAAGRLALRCRELETLGFVPGDVPSPERVTALAADARTRDWAMQIGKTGVYALMERMDAETGVASAVMLFWVGSGDESFLYGASSQDGDKTVTLTAPVESPRNDHFGLGSYYALSDDGYATVNVPPAFVGDMLQDPPAFLAWVTRFGFTPDNFAQAVQAAQAHNELQTAAERPRG